MRLLVPWVALTATLLGCGGGEFAELFVKLITARFVPAQVTASLGVHRVELEVSCDRAGLNTPFGRLGIQVKLDPDRRLPAGVTATPVGAPVGADGFATYPCTDPTATPDLKLAHVMVDVNVVGEAAPASAITLIALIQVEPLVAGEPSKDSTTAELALAVAAAPSVPGGNLLINPSFADAVQLGGLPTAPDNWRGDLAASVIAENGITPHSGATMLKFQATGAVGSTNTLSSQQWQIVDLSGRAEAIGAGTVRVDASAWFNRIAGDELTDRRFDLRLLAFDGSPADLPARYAAASWIAQQTTTVISAANLWQQAQASLELPPATRYVLVEIYAYEDMFNDAEIAEFAGHYADDISLVLAQP
jgi:hypothetical protein